MTDPDLRIAAIGCGGRLESHAAAIAAVDGVRLVAGFDVDPGRTQAAAEAYGVVPHTALDEMLADEAPDAVTIVTPPWVRREVVADSVQAGVKALLIEKPIALSPSEAAELVALCEGRLAAVNTQYQWMPHWRALWPRIADGALGEVHTIRCSTWLNVIEQGPHTIDLATTIARHAGLPPAGSVRAWGQGVDRYVRGERVPSSLEATFTLGGARMTCVHGDTGLLVPGETDPCLPIHVEAIGSAGRLWVSLTQGWWLQTREGWEHGPTDWIADDLAAQTAVIAELRDHVTAAANGTFPTSIERAVANQDMLFGAIVACLTREEIDLGAPIDEAVLDDEALWAALGPEREAE